MAVFNFPRKGVDVSANIEKGSPANQVEDNQPELIIKEENAELYINKAKYPFLVGNSGFQRVFKLKPVVVNFGFAQVNISFSTFLRDDQGNRASMVQTLDFELKEGEYDIYYELIDQLGYGQAISRRAINTLTENVLDFLLFDVQSLDFMTPIWASAAVNADQATITVSEGAGTFEYRIDGGAWQTDNVFAGLTAGDHTYEVRSATDGAIFAGKFNIEAAAV